MERMENHPTKRAIDSTDNFDDDDSDPNHIVSPKRRRLSGEQVPLAEQIDDNAHNEHKIRDDNQKSNQEPKVYFDIITDKKILEKIFDHLDLYDLLQVCEADTRYVQVIGELIMMKRNTLNITEISKHYSVRHALKKFGRFVREISIKQSDIQWKDDKLSHIEEIVRLIGKRCPTQVLEKLTITFDLNDKMTYKFRKNIPDCLKTLDSLTIVQDCPPSNKLDTCYSKILKGCTQLKVLTLIDFETSSTFLPELNSTQLTELHIISRRYDNKLDTFIGKTLNGCTQLKVLTLERLRTSGSFLSALNFMQLTELHIHNSSFIETSSFKDFLQLGIPSLKTFSIWDCDSRYSKTVIKRNEIEQIPRSFPSLEKLLLKYIADANYSRIGQLTNLKSLHLDIPYTHFEHVISRNFLEVLKTMNSLEELSIEGWFKFCNDIEIWKETMQSLTSLRSISFLQVFHPNWSDIINLIKELPSVTSIHLSGSLPLNRGHIEQLVAISPEMQVIKLDMPIAAFTPSLYDKLVQTRLLWHRKSQQLNLYVDPQRVNILKRSSLYAINSRCIAVHPIEK